MKQVIHLVAGFLKRTDWLLLLLCLRPTLDRAETTHPAPAEKEDKPL